MVGAIRGELQVSWRIEPWGRNGERIVQVVRDPTVAKRIAKTLEVGGQARERGRELARDQLVERLALAVEPPDGELPSSRVPLLCTSPCLSSA